MTWSLWWAHATTRVHYPPWQCDGVAACGASPAGGDADNRLFKLRVPESDASRVAGLRQGLNEAGYVEGRNLAVENRWAQNQFDRLPALAADLIQRQVAVIVASGLPSSLAAKGATKSIPVVFVVGADPVQVGLVASLNRPGGNLTGFSQISGELGAKGIEILHELLPSTPAFGFLVNPRNPIAELTMRDVLVAAVSVVN
jgi:putative tryptophan/tyrosine transport system substrate-binding protein